MHSNNMLQEQDYKKRPQTMHKPQIIRLNNCWILVHWNAIQIIGIQWVNAEVH